MDQIDQQYQQLKQIPYSEEAERATLGGLIVDVDDLAWDKVADIVSKDDFYFEAHQVIFEAAKSLSAEQKPVDVITLAQQLDNMHQLEKIGGQAYLAQLALETPTSANIRAYGQIVRDYSLFRQMIQVGTKIVERAHNPEGHTPTNLLDQAEAEIFSIAENSENKNEIWVTTKDALKSAHDKISALSDPTQREAFQGIQTGWEKYNEMTNGVQRGDLVIVAGRPSMGKTTFAMNMATHIALSGKAVGVFSIEMGAEQLMMRILASLSEISLKSIFDGTLDADEYPRLTGAVKQFRYAKMFIDESSTLTPIDVRSRARRLQRREGELGLIVIDYLQLMSSSGKVESRQQEISQISRSLKALAKELDVPVIALSQLSRKNMDRPDKRPILSDLRESGAIEQDADLICFVHRPEMVETDETAKEELRGKAEIIIGKHRNGPTGTIPLRFKGQYNKFEDPTEAYFEDEFSTQS